MDWSHTCLFEILALRSDRKDKIALVTDDQWEQLLTLAKVQHVTPLVYTRLRDKGMETAVPPNIWHTLQLQYQLNTMRNLSLYRELKQLAIRLAEAAVPLIVLKGAFLADAVYDSMGERIVGDLDLLVPIDNLPQVLEISKELAYQPDKPIILEAVLRRQRHLPFFIHPERLLVVEWHTHIVHPDARHVIPLQPLWDRAVQSSVIDIPILTFCPEDLLLHVAEHLSYHHEFSFGLRSLCDISVICDHYQAEIEWAGLVERVNTWRWERGVYLAFRLAVDHLGAAIPQAVLDGLRPKDFIDELLQTAVSQLFTDPRTFDSVPTAYRELKKATSLPEKAGILYRSLFPTPERMQVRYGLDAHAMGRMQRYLYRWRDLLRQLQQNRQRRATLTTAVQPAIRRRNQLSTWMDSK